MITQFIGEALIVVFIAMLISVALIELFIPEMNRLLDTNMHVSFLSNWIFNIGLLDILILVSLLAGNFPQKLPALFGIWHYQLFLCFKIG